MKSTLSIFLVYVFVLSAACTAISSNVSEILLISWLIHSASLSLSPLSPSNECVNLLDSQNTLIQRACVSEMWTNCTPAVDTFFFYLMPLTKSSLCIVCLFLFLFTCTVCVSTVTINIYFIFLLLLSLALFIIMWTFSLCCVWIAASFVHTIYLIWVEIAFNILPTSAHSVHSLSISCHWFTLIP